MAEPVIPTLDEHLEEDSVTLSSVDEMPHISVQQDELQPKLNKSINRLVKFSWEYSPAVQVIYSDSQALDGLADELLSEIPPHWHIARLEAPLQQEESDLITQLAESWDVTLTKGRASDVQGLAARIERQNSGGERYLLLIDVSDSLSEEQWRFFRALSQASKGIIRMLMIGGPRVCEQCGLFFTPFGVECRYMEFSALASEENDALIVPSATQLGMPQDKSDEQGFFTLKKTLSIVVVLAVLLSLLLLQNGIFDWLNDGAPSAESQLSLPSTGQNIGKGDVRQVAPRELELVAAEPVSEVAVAGAEQSPSVAKEPQVNVAVPQKALPSEKPLSQQIEKSEVVAPSVEEKPASTAAQVSKEEKATVVAKVEVDQTKVAQAELKNGLRVEGWILAQDPNAFTLHLMSVRSEQSLRKLIVENDWQQHAAYYKAYRKSGEWYVLVYGQYASEKAAQKDKGLLAKKLKVKDALIRNYEVFHKDIRSH